MAKKEISTFYPPNRQAWRDWLQQHHRTEQAVWLLAYKKSSAIPSVSWSELVDEALCFGWIDSTRKTVDHQSFIQFFTRRKPRSSWSKVNKNKIEQLIGAGLMTPAGLESVKTAQENGSWSILDEAEDLIIPDDLEQALSERPGALEAFLGLSKSAKKLHLHQLALAKRPETRQKRIRDIVDR
jgi:uncharacterized protein YdeI (YjbR/CyaY-like superfamily)